MQLRILNIINGLLVLLCAGCIYYLATAHYEQPGEITAALASLNETDMGRNETRSTSTPPPPNYPNLNKGFMTPLFTPTPTPSPTPTPPPAPPNLREGIAQWVITSLDDKSADITDNKTKETFTLNVGGPGHGAADNRGMGLEAKLIKVDLDTLRATFGYADQTETKNFN